MSDDFRTPAQRFAMKVHWVWMEIEETVLFPLYLLGILKRDDK
jgi:hypothetical protein